MSVDTLAEALIVIDGFVPPSDKRRLKKLAHQAGIDDTICRVHHGLGRAIRNAFELWGPRGEELRNDVWEHTPPERQEYYRGWWAEHGDPSPGGHYMHPDDCSTEIIRAYLERLMELPA